MSDTGIAIIDGWPHVIVHGTDITFIVISFVFILAGVSILILYFWVLKKNEEELRK